MKLCNNKNCIMRKINRGCMLATILKPLEIAELTYDKDCRHSVLSIKTIINELEGIYNGICNRG